MGDVQFTFQCSIRDTNQIASTEVAFYKSSHLIRPMIHHFLYRVFLLIIFVAHFVNLKFHFQSLADILAVFDEQLSRLLVREVEPCHRAMSLVARSHVQLSNTDREQIQTNEQTNKEKKR